MREHQAVMAPVRKALIGLPISHLWRGHGSAIFLEFGRLTPRIRLDGSLGNPCGEWSMMIEWNWRFERPRSILGGAWSDPRRWPGFFRAVLDSSVTDLQAVGTLPEIELSLSNGMRVCTFMNDAGQPAWSFIDYRASPLECWSVARGRIVHEQLKASASRELQAADT